MQKTILYSIFAVGSILIWTSCLDQKEKSIDVINDLFPESQKEIRKAVESIVRDCETANFEGLKSIHLDSDKFTKFGPRKFERQDVKSTNVSEVAYSAQFLVLKPR